MKKVITDICNGLMAMSISVVLQENDGFSVYPVKDRSVSLTAECEAASADIVLMEVAYHPGFTMDERLNEVRHIREVTPSCKVLLMCDENSAPELARKVAKAKRDGLVDEFVYSSVSERYLVAMLDAM